MKFQDPPQRQGTSKHPHYEIAAELRARPNEWAIVFENSEAQYASIINMARVKAYLPAGSFEARSVGIKGDVSIYARYVGGVETND